MRAASPAISESEQMKAFASQADLKPKKISFQRLSQSA